MRKWIERIVGQLDPGAARKRPRAGSISGGVLVVMLLAPVAALDAGTYKGLEPGSSTRAEVERVLGQPIRTVESGARYDYRPVGEDSARLSVEFDPRNERVVAIDLYFTEQYSKEDYRDWFELGAPSSTRRSASGNLVEVYDDAGISLHFTGSGGDSLVEFFRHFDPDRKLSDRQQPEPRATETPVPAQPIPSEAQYIRSAHDAEEREDWAGLGPIVEEGLREYPESAELWEMRGFFYFHNRSISRETRTRESLLSVERAYELDDSAERAAAVGWVHYYLLEDCGTAMDYFELAEPQYGSRNPTLLYYMATCFEEWRRARKAREYYSRFLDLAPNDPLADEARDRLRRIPG